MHLPIRNNKLLFFYLEEESGGSPWAGSLRHVAENKNKKSKRKDSEEYGQAPWMGTLR